MKKQEWRAGRDPQTSEKKTEITKKESDKILTTWKDHIQTLPDEEHTDQTDEAAKGTLPRRTGYLIPASSGESCRPKREAEESPG